jgi:hypothetical protein
LAFWKPVGDGVLPQSWVQGNQQKWWLNGIKWCVNGVFIVFNGALMVS